MNSDAHIFPQTDAKLVSVMEELQAREPIFHHPELGVTRQDLLNQTVADYWEVGASGNIYDRDRVVTSVEKRFTEGTEPDTSKWETSDFQCRELGENTYLLTYKLNQDGRLSRRATIWRKENESWKIVYHQGTLITG